MANQVSPLTVSERAAGTACLLTVRGIVDSSTYLRLRDAIVKAALDEPSAVLVDVNGLDVPALSALAVFTSARWLVGTWPATPIHLVCADAERRKIMARNGITRYIQIHPTTGAALTALRPDTHRAVSRASTELPATLASLRTAREFVARQLSEWSFRDRAPIATVAANVFVENVLQHTSGGLVLALETDGDALTVSVRDDSSTPAARHEDPRRGADRISGLAIVASVCRAWGCSPTPSGKTVWAIIGPENRL
ncbi:sulfate transporter [Mycobacterium sp.]|uniref:sulfate transporter n=1 Tax=Mycobacterium sp. TaxID=1785 RepID=UPI0025F33799|nr:sulfate transporter [Mycobacterium sp.]